MAGPAAFLGYGVYLVSRSAIVGGVVGLVILLVCRLLLGPVEPRQNSDGEQSGD